MLTTVMIPLIVLIAPSLGSVVPPIVPSVVMVISRVAPKVPLSAVMVVPPLVPVMPFPTLVLVTEVASALSVAVKSLCRQYRWFCRSLVEVLKCRRIKLSKKY